MSSIIFACSEPSNSMLDDAPNGDRTAVDDEADVAELAADTTDVSKLDERQGIGGEIEGDEDTVDSTPAEIAAAAASDAGATDAGTKVAATMSFFVSSRGIGKGGDFRAKAGATTGLGGADALCKTLAMAVSAQLGVKTWRAYLSTDKVNARDRIGKGPWRNAKGVVIATNLAQLHEQNGQANLLSAATALDENGNTVADKVHDIVTGSTSLGLAAPNRNCNQWTSNAATNRAILGHSNRKPIASWNAAHLSAGCAQAGAKSLSGGSGRGSIYCFAR